MTITEAVIEWEFPIFEKAHPNHDEDCHVFHLIWETNVMALATLFGDFGNIPICDIRAKNVSAWRSELLSKGIPRHHLREMAGLAIHLIDDHLESFDHPEYPREKVERAKQRLHKMVSES